LQDKLVGDTKRSREGVRIEDIMPKEEVDKKSYGFPSKSSPADQMRSKSRRPKVVATPELGTEEVK